MFSSFSVSILPILKKYNIPVVITAHDYPLVCPASALLNGKLQICTKCQNGRYYNCLINKCGKSGYLRAFSFSWQKCISEKIFYPVNHYIDTFIFVSQASFQLYAKLNPEFKKYNHQVIYNPIETKAAYNPHRGNYILYFGRLSEEKRNKNINTNSQTTSRYPNKNSGKWRPRTK